MPSWVWVLIAIGVVVVVAVIVWQGVGRRRTDKLQTQFGPEYDRTIERADSRREAETELQQREERRRELEIRPLPRDAREENYREGHRLARSSADGSGSTEDLRQAMRHYRALFDGLVEHDGRDIAQERASDEPAADRDRRPSEERTVR